MVISERLSVPVMRAEGAQLLRVAGDSGRGFDFVSGRLTSGTTQLRHAS
jgi:hypothetical protein